MAVYAAHLTRTLAGSPSIFEITAQEQLASTVRPALRKLIEFIAACNPTRCSWLVRWYDELYLLFNGILQYHYLRHYAASFSESFYGLQRASAAPTEFTDGFHLPVRAERASLALLALLPYVRAKLEDAVERYRERDHAPSSKSWGDTTHRLLVRAYIAAHCAYESLCLVNALAYMTGRTRCAAPLLRLAGVTLAYAPESAADDDHTWRQLWASVASGDLRSATVTFNMVGTAVLRGMEVGAFFVQFLKWWESAGVAGAPALPVPSPAELDEKATRVMNKCPVCLQPWRIPTALPVSGYIFCYKCISRHLRETGSCPVTRYPAREQDLIRMYLDQ